MDFVARVFGREELAYEIGKHMTCSEADCLAVGMALGDRREAAATFLIGHAHGDDDPDDKHVDLIDPLAEQRGMDYQQSFLREKAGEYLDHAITAWTAESKKEEQ